MPLPVQSVNKELGGAHGEDTRREAHARRLGHAHITFTHMLVQSEKQAGTALCLGLLINTVVYIKHTCVHTHTQKYMNMCPLIQTLNDFSHSHNGSKHSSQRDPLAYITVNMKAHDSVCVGRGIQLLILLIRETSATLHIRVLLF